MTDNLIFDEEAAEQLVKEAQLRKRNASRAGISAYLPEERLAPRLRADTKFLSNVINRLGSHNDWVSRKEQNAPSSASKKPDRQEMNDSHTLRSHSRHHRSSREKRQRHESDSDDTSRRKSRRGEDKDDDGKSRSDRHSRHRHHRSRRHHDRPKDEKHELDESGRKLDRYHDSKKERSSTSRKTSYSKKRDEPSSPRRVEQKTIYSSSDEDIIGPMPAARGRGATTTTYGASSIDEHFKEDYEPANDITTT